MSEPVVDLMLALRVSVEQARENIIARNAERNRMMFEDFVASQQDNPPEWWDEEPE